METARVYISVRVLMLPSGRMIPLALTWEDGQVYRIDRVGRVRLMEDCKTGSLSDCYTIYICNRESRLYFEHSRELTGTTIGRWYVLRQGFRQ